MVWKATPKWKQWYEDLKEVKESPKDISVAIVVQVEETVQVLSAFCMPQSPARGPSGIGVITGKAVMRESHWPLPQSLSLTYGL